MQCSKYPIREIKTYLEVNQFQDYSQTNLDQSPPVLRDFLPLKSPSGKMDWSSYKSYEDHLLFYRHLLKSFKHVGVSNLFLLFHRHQILLQIFAQLSQKSRLKLQLLAEIVIFSFNPTTHPDKYEGNDIEQNLENEILYE